MTRFIYGLKGGPATQLSQQTSDHTMRFFGLFRSSSPSVARPKAGTKVSVVITYAPANRPGQLFEITTKVPLDAYRQMEAMQTRGDNFIASMFGAGIRLVAISLVTEDRAAKA